MVTHDPLHRSGRAAFPHPALASGDDPKSPQRISLSNSAAASRRRSSPAKSRRTPAALPIAAG